MTSVHITLNHYYVGAGKGGAGRSYREALLGIGNRIQQDISIHDGLSTTSYRGFGCSGNVNVSKTQVNK